MSKSKLKFRKPGVLIGSALIFLVFGAPGIGGRRPTTDPLEFQRVVMKPDSPDPPRIEKLQSGSVLGFQGLALQRSSDSGDLEEQFQAGPTPGLNVNGTLPTCVLSTDQKLEASKGTVEISELHLTVLYLTPGKNAFGTEYRFRLKDLMQKGYWDLVCTAPPEYPHLTLPMMTRMMRGHEDSSRGVVFRPLHLAGENDPLPGEKS
ncbi:MAG: hypothetical protein ACXWPM_02620, partial [Bdellovibrionota bacterium]